MNYEMTVLAAIIQADKPTTKLVSELTGISIRKVQTVLLELPTTFGIELSRNKEGNKEVLCIVKWGVFESGSHLKKLVQSMDLQQIKSSRVKKSEKSDALTFNDKFMRYEHSKLKNYRASLGLEGIQASSRQIPTDKSKRQNLRQALLKKHSQPNSKAAKHG
jgi:hypothetical protein